MAFTEKNLEELENALADGVLEVEYQGRKVKFHSISEMLELRDRMIKDLRPIENTRKVAVFRKGF